MTTITCSRIVFVDSEFDAKKGRGERPGFPVCICAIEKDQNGTVTKHRLAAPYPTRPPWDRGDPYLTVGFSLPAEAGSFMTVGWSLPKPAIDLYAEYMTIHNTELTTIGARSGDSKPPPTLISACKRYGLAGMNEIVKADMRSLAYTKTGHTPQEIASLQDYCLDDDCRMTMNLFYAMLPHIDLLRAPLRGAFMMETERIRWRGIPIDMDDYSHAVKHAPAIVAKMRADLNRKLAASIYYCGVFKQRAVFQVMQRHKIPIPIDPKTRKPTCALKQIKGMIETYPLLKIFYQDQKMIKALASLKKLEIGTDGRNRSWLNPLGTKTGRNNPSTNRVLYGLPFTMRSFMKPESGMALAETDFGNEEVGIAAALSKDPTLIEDYRSGDPYRKFAADALGILNPTKQQRQIYKGCVLGRIYGLGVESLALNLGLTCGQAQRIMDQMSARYPVLNAWLERTTTKAAHCVPITCVLGWSLAMTGKPGEWRTFLNFPMQGNGGELMRLVIVRASHLNIIWCAHDSFLIEDTIERIEQSVAELQLIMRQASRDLLGGFELRADCDPDDDVVYFPNRFVDKREREVGMQNWKRLMILIDEAESSNDEK